MTKKVETKVTQPKNITFASIKRTAKEANTMENYDLNENERIRFYPIFSAGKIKELAKELSLVITQANEKEIELTDEQFENHIYFLCIKYFTHLGKSLSNDYTTQVVQMEQLVDAGVFEIIIDEIFLPSEIQKVMNSIGKHIGTSNYIAMVSNRAEERLQELKIKHQDIEKTLEEISKGKNDTELQQ